VFNLVKYRLWFLGISLLVIIPGLISLFLYGLNLGIDFTNGTSITVIPQRAFSSSNEVEKMLAQFKLSSLQVQLATNKNLQPHSTVWIKLNTQVDDTVDKALRKALDDKYGATAQKGALHYTTTNMGKSYVIYQVSGFTTAPKVDDIQELLSKLPNTGASTATPQATVTATPTANQTPVATQTTSPTTSSGTPVKVEKVLVGTTNQTVQINTLTQIDTSATTGSQGHVTFPAIQQAILNQGGPYLTITTSSQIGPAVATQTTRNAVLAVIVASLFIMLYIWFSFRKVPKALRYAISTVIALLHDVLIVVGVFSILGKFADIQIDALFITALLTVVGFSVHDTIVVFDRVRENMQRRTSESFDEVVNASLVQTMARSLNTSLTVLFTLLTLTLFTEVGTSVHNFTLALLIGIFSGTYSSIFNASMLLVVWEKGELGFKHLGGGKEKRSPTRRERESRKREMATTHS
jgi:preprotein translocase SecF subunit